MSKSPLRIKGNYPDGVLNIAHRGARAYAPENTLAAFEKAKIFGCQMFEIDVHQAKDGELIVHHDDQLTRCTNAKSKFPDRSSYFLSDFTCDELLTLDAGSWYAEQLSLPAAERQMFLQSLTDQEIEHYISRQDLAVYASGAIKLPTLRQTLELARHLDLMVNIEIKMRPVYLGIADAVVNLVESLAMEQHVLISSFDHDQLHNVRQLTGTIATGILTGDRLADPDAYLKSLDADAYHPGCDSLGFGSAERKPDADTINKIRAIGCGVNVWTCNDKADMRQLLALGVSGLISDYPNRVRDVLAEFHNSKCFRNRY